MNTKPPAVSAVRSVWTSRDEATLKELTERRTRIMEQNMATLLMAMEGCCASAAETRFAAEVLISNAETVILALKPFTEPE